MSQATEKTYSGSADKGRRTVTVDGGRGPKPLRCLDFFTPRFAWGYHAAGPSELAIAILHDHYGLRKPVFDERVLKLYDAFADEIVAKFARDRDWSLGTASVDDWLDQTEKRRPGSTLGRPPHAHPAIVQPSVQLEAPIPLEPLPEPFVAPEPLLPTD